MNARVLKSDVFLRWLESQGIVPTRCLRVVMDFRVGHVPKIYAELIGTEELLVNPPDLRGVEIIVPPLKASEL